MLGEICSHYTVGRLPVAKRVHTSHPYVETGKPDSACTDRALLRGLIAADTDARQVDVMADAFGAKICQSHLEDRRGRRFVSRAMRQPPPGAPFCQVKREQTATFLHLFCVKAERSSCRADVITPNDHVGKAIARCRRAWSSGTKGS